MAVFSGLRSSTIDAQSGEDRKKGVEPNFFSRGRNRGSTRILQEVAVHPIADVPMISCKLAAIDPIRI